MKQALMLLPAIALTWQAGISLGEEDTVPDLAKRAESALQPGRDRPAQLGRCLFG